MNELTSLNDLDNMMKWADQLSKSSIVPDAYKNKPGNIIAALQMGRELGLQPMQSLKNVIVINGSTALSADVKVGICMAHQSFRGISYESNDRHAKVTIKREMGGEVLS